MAIKTLRKLPPRPGTYLALGFLVGLLMAGAAGFGWWRLGLDASRRQSFFLYAEVSVPFPATIPASRYAKGFGTPDVWPAKAKLYKGPIRIGLQMLAFKGKSFLQLLIVPAIAMGVCLSLCLILSAVAFGFATRNIRNWNRLRGPNQKTIREFNKITKGDGFGITAMDFKEQ